MLILDAATHLRSTHLTSRSPGCRGAGRRARAPRLPCEGAVGVAAGQNRQNQNRQNHRPVRAGNAALRGRATSRAGGIAINRAGAAAVFDETPNVFKKTPNVKDSIWAGQYVAPDLPDTQIIPLLMKRCWIAVFCTTATGCRMGENLYRVAWISDRVADGRPAATETGRRCNGGEPVIRYEGGGAAGRGIGSGAVATDARRTRRGFELCDVELEERQAGVRVGALEIRLRAGAAHCCAIRPGEA